MFAVNLLGKFQIMNGAGVLNDDNICSEMIVKLLSFIIVHRDHTLTVNELIDVLWQEDETNNPAGALKNLMYRLRTIMKKTFGDGEYIITTRGAYYWNYKYKMIVDIEEYEKLCEKGDKTKNNYEQKIKYYEEAIKLYQGNFLTKYSSMHWIVPLSTYYHSLFLTTVKKIAKLYVETQQYEKMEKVCTNALCYDAVDERLHCLLIKALIYQNKNELAKEYYDRAEKLLYSTLGVRKSAKLNEVHNELMKTKNGVRAVEIQEVNEEMAENNNPEGAYICGYPIFKEIYRLESRRINRLGLSEYVLLMTVSLAKEAMDNSNEKYNEYHINRTMSCLEEALRESLRIGDVAARYSDSQYIVLLPTLDYEDSIMVTNRITANLYEKVSNKRISVKSDITEMAMVESLGK